jgi:hypothetical protein
MLYLCSSVFIGGYESVDYETKYHLRLAVSLHSQDRSARPDEMGGLGPEVSLTART